MGGLLEDMPSNTGVVAPLFVSLILCGLLSCQQRRVRDNLTMGPRQAHGHSGPSLLGGLLKSGIPQLLPMPMECGHHSRLAGAIEVCE